MRRVAVWDTRNHGTKEQLLGSMHVTILSSYHNRPERVTSNTRVNR